MMLKEKFVVKNKKNRFISETDFKIPKFEDFSNFEFENYSVFFLKEICKNYKLKLSGSKNTLKTRIYDFLKNSFYAIKIQKNYKKFFIKNYLKLFGPSLFSKNCINDTDFFTLENINEIKFNNFISYKDSNNKVWGFNIKSLYQLFLKSNSNTVNPYTREIIHLDIYDNIQKIIKLSKILNIPIDIIIKEDNNISFKKRVEFKILELFQIIDNLGNYTDVKWFLNLNRNGLAKFLIELYDIWIYRAQLEQHTKISICYPTGNPFSNCNINNINQYTFISLQKMVLQIIEEFITKGTNAEMCNLGASYILCAFTLVSNEAAISLPWLYESVVI